MQSVVGGWEIVLNEVILRDILGIPHVGPQAYEIKTWPVVKGFDYGEALVYLLGDAIIAADAPRKIHANQLQIRLRLVHLICSHNLIPRTGHRDRWDIERLREISGCLSVRLVMRMRMLMMIRDVLSENEPEGEERISTMHKAQKKFLEERFTSMQEEQRTFFEEMKTLMARFPPNS
ncbi:hypothetical protein CJ030_MR0G006911 [Morella rubra]|uniref:Uncharacterized protein n=1 Tax=Morella rubra TaxID=262757 RepID=A0A6A1ULA6_9ROSI|nr:hypothetical protein CJ030_MR0G006911 [Morella rubra]